MKPTALLILILFCVFVFMSFIKGNFEEGNKSLAVTKSKCLPKSGQVVIGVQTWMTKNLDVDTFQNGDKIKEAKTIEEWKAADASKTPAWCNYKNSVDSAKIYGKLYNFHAVSDSRGIAPKGFRVPTADDYTTLTSFLLGEKTSGGKIKNACGWLFGGNGSNTTGFSAFPGGSRANDGSFDYIGYYGIFWTGSEYGNNYAWYYALTTNHERIYKDSNVKGCGFSVRCMFD